MKITLKYFFLLFIVPSMILASAGAAVTGKVMQVKDGDTVVIAPTEGGQFFICRLYGIDAPEIAHNGQPGQTHGPESEKDLKKLILGQEVTVEIRDRDKYSREVCVIRKDGADINRDMISRGSAWAYVKYLKSPYASEYIDAEKEARDKRVGLWHQSNPMPPWEFRKQQR
jgi:endonuclease YncB( thermonuclease family)